MIFEQIRQHRAFALFCGLRLISTTAVFIQNIAIGWQVYSIARLDHTIEQSAFLVGMVGLTEFVPLFALALLGGEAADRYDRRKIMLVCSIMTLGCSIMLLLLALTPKPSLIILFSAVALFGVARAFFSPATGSLAPTLVPPDVLPRAIAWNTLSFQSGMVLGPWLGGMLCTLGVQTAYGVSGMLFLITIGGTLILLGMPLNTQAVHQGASRLTMIKEGIVYLIKNKIVLGAISLDLFAVFLGGATALLPVFARDILNIGADGFGTLRSGAALGGGLMTLCLGIRPIKRHAGPLMLGSVIVFGIATICFAFSRTLWLSMALLIVLGAADSVSVFVRQSLVQLMTPNNMRGRVTSVSGLFISASNELGEFESGVAARLLGPVGAIVFGGVGSILVTLLWSRLFPALRKADRLVAPEL